MGITNVKKEREAWEILLYIPNIIGYFRLWLLLAAYWNLEKPWIFLGLYSISASLDFFDGWAARRFNQRSSFGAWLDVILDNISRSLIWSNIFQWGWMIVTIEWITFVGNHQAGSKWRELNQRGKSTGIPQLTIPTPVYVQKVMAKGFKTPLGTLAISGLHALPVWIYAMQMHVLDDHVPFLVSMFICLVLVAGRLICLSVELWCIQKHIRELLWEDQIVLLDNKSL